MEVLSTFDSSLFHFLRPQWLWALLVLLPLAWWLWQGGHSAGAWKQWVDPALQPHVLTQGKTERRWYKRLWLLMAWLLATLALAGPTWEQRPTPLLRSEQARIVVLDLSRSMLAKDLRPSRLNLARLKVRDLLQQSRDSKAGLVAFAAQAFPIAPLTDDIQTLLAQVPSLHPDLMPAQGGRIDRALLQAAEMLKNGAAGSGGQVLLVTDSAPQEAAFAAAQALRDMGYELSVLAVGTEQGGPIPEDTRRGRGFVKDRGGNIVIAKLPVTELRQLALSGGGNFSLLTADDADIQKLNKVLDRDQPGAEADHDAARAGDQWVEAGPYLLLLLLPLAALGFRRGWLMAVLLAVSLPQQQNAWAGAEANAGPGSSLWFNADQRGKQALESGQPEQAQGLFESTAWKAAAQYRAGQYAEAAEYWQQQQSPQALYNQGNALARSGDLAGAMAAWQQVPEDAAEYPAAQHNAELIKPLLEQQQQQQDSDDAGEEGDSEQSQQDQQSQNSPEQGEQGQPQDSSQQQSYQQSGQESGQEPGQESGQQSGQPQAEETDSNDSDAAEAKSDSERPLEPSKDEEAPEAEAGSALSAQESAEQQAQDQVVEQWLRRIPDDPGGLLREKFKRDYQRRAQQRGGSYQDEEEAW